MLGQALRSACTSAPAVLLSFSTPLPVNTIYATDLQARLAVSRLGTIARATWGLLGGEAVFIPLVALYLFWWGCFV